MRMILYGFKNVLRDKIRSLIVALLISLPFFAIFMMNSTQGAIDHQISRIKENVGTLIHIRPRKSLGHINQAGGLNRLLPEKSLERIKSIPNLKNIARIEPYLIAIEPLANYYMTLHIGVRIDDKKRLESHGEVGDPRIIAGRNFLPEDDGEDVAIVGMEYAEKVGIDLEKFDQQTFFVKETLKPGPGLIKSNLKSIGGKPFRIVGIFNSGYSFGDNQLFLPYRTFKKHYDVQEGISKIYVTVDSLDNLEIVAEQIRNILRGEADIITAKQGSRFVSVALGTMNLIAGVWVIISMILMILVTLFSMLLVTEERYQEIGTLKAIGASTWNIAQQFIAEAIALTFLGGLGGILLFKTLGSVIGKVFFQVVFYVYVPGHYGKSLVENFILDYSISNRNIILLLMMSLIVGGIGSSYSIFKARTMSPMEAIRYE